MLPYDKKSNKISSILGWVGKSVGVGLARCANWSLNANSIPIHLKPIRRTKYGSKMNTKWATPSFIGVGTEGADDTLRLPKTTDIRSRSIDERKILTLPKPSTSHNRSASQRSSFFRWILKFLSGTLEKQQQQQQHQHRIQCRMANNTESGSVGWPGRINVEH